MSIRTLTALLAAVLVTVGADAATPKFLEVGRTYSITTLVGSRTAKVLEIDKDVGWIKVQIDKPRPETLWVNLGAVTVINETIAPADKPLLPVSFGK